MKKNLLILIFALSSVIMLDSCGSNSSKETKKSTTEEAVLAEYTCPMHSEVQSKEPGKCPKCGMDLVEKKKQDVD